MYLAALFALTALADPFCSDVTRLAEGAREPIAFQSLKDTGFKPRLLGAGCFPGGEGYFCQQSKLPADMNQQSFASRIAACVPGAKITVEKRPGSKPETVVSAAELRIEIEESGSDQAPNGRVLRSQILTDR